MEQLRIGVVGAGFMGGLHARVVAESGTALLVAVADPDADRGGDLAGRFGTTAYSGHKEMFSGEQLDGVIVATPEPLHREAVIAAAEHRVAVLVEKPIAASLDDADAMIAACEKAGVSLMVGYILRFEPAYARIKQAVEAGTLGRLLTGYARRNAPIDEGRRLAGRTTVINYLAVHDLDQLLWYNPAQPVRVSAKAVHGRIHAELGVADFTWTTVDFADGSLGVVESGWGLTGGWAGWTTPETWGGFGDVELNLIGTDGVASLEFTPMNLSAVDDKEGWRLPDTRHWPVINGRLVGALKNESDHFLSCLASGTPPLIDGREGRRSLEVGLAADRSIAEGRPIDLPLE